MASYLAAGHPALTLRARFPLMDRCALHILMSMGMCVYVWCVYVHVCMVCVCVVYVYVCVWYVCVCV